MPQSTHNSVSDLRLLQRVLLGAAVLAVSLPCVARAEMQIRDYQKYRHDRFYAGDDKDFVGKNFNWSGVGKTSSSKWVTMVSPSYFLSAHHLKPIDGESVTFFEGNDGSPSHDYTVAAGGEQIWVSGSLKPTDLWLGKLTTPLDAGHHINYYPILMLDPESSYLNNMVLFNYGQIDRVGRNILDGIEDASSDVSIGRSMLYDFDNDDVPSVGGDETFLISGDSGGPSFANWNGEPALLGIHWFNDQSDPNHWYSGDTFVPHYFDAINGSMTGETLTEVPEPSTLALWVIVGLLGLGFRWKRRLR